MAKRIELAEGKAGRACTGCEEISITGPMIVAEQADAGERPDGIEVPEGGRYCESCATEVGLIYADGTLRPVEDRARMYDGAQPESDCPHCFAGILKEDDGSFPNLPVGFILHDADICHACPAGIERNRTAVTESDIANKEGGRR